jgi:D-glycero-D-manno-heptose 1,7-bisphosphate phosphatase
VILDRDGVLNREVDAGWIDDPRAWRWERGALEGLALLARSQVAVSVATNQSGIGRGAVSAAGVERVHTWLVQQLAALGLEVVGVFCCPHAPDARCTCRKPAPGLVEAAIAASGTPPSETVLVGDDRRDLEAAAAAGVRAVLVRTGKGAQVAPDLAPGTPVHDDLHRAVQALLGASPAEVGP